MNARTHARTHTPEFLKRCRRSDLAVELLLKSLGGVHVEVDMDRSRFAGRLHKNLSVSCEENNADRKHPQQKWLQSMTILLKLHHHFFWFWFGQNF